MGSDVKFAVELLMVGKQRKGVFQADLLLKVADKPGDDVVVFVCTPRF
jgi:hypothetical protein